jgi:hypothetical protein
MSPEPPRLAVALLTRFLPAEEALAGDLIEEFEARRSRAWFWRQTVGAIVIGALRRPDPGRPLRLLDGQSGRTLRAPGVARGVARPVNLTASPIPGVGGFTLVVLAVLVTFVAPGAWWAIAAALVLGIALGLVLIAINRTRIG